MFTCRPARSALILLTVLLAVFAGAASHTSSVAAATVCIDSEEQALLDQLNAYRAANGKPAVTVSHTLSAAADTHSLDMGVNSAYSHTLSDGTSWQQNIANHGYAYAYQTYLGENLAAGIDRADLALGQWKGSSTHNANLLNKYFRTVGIGRVYVEGSQYRWYWTLTFGGIADGAAASCGTTTTSSPTPSPSPSPSPSPAPTTTYSIVGSSRTANSSSSAYAYDGKTTTAWGTISTSIPTYAYATFDLGGSKSVRSIQWLWAETGWADRVRIQVSTTGSSWTTVATVGNAAAGTWQSLSVSTTARYVRFYFENPNKDAKLGSLAEVKIGG